MKKKSVLWLLMGVLLLIVPLLTACGGESPAPEPAPKPAPAAAPAPTPTPAPAPEPTAATPVAIPHTLEGRNSCLMCHETGIGNATAVPADHTGRTNDTCAACHKPAGD